MTPLQLHDELKVKFTSISTGEERVVDGFKVIYIDPTDSEGVPFAIINIFHPANGLLWCDSEGCVTASCGDTATTVEITRNGQSFPVNSGQPH
jgi:hypothetical protein